MPNAAPIVVNDGTSDVTFSPNSVSATHYELQNLAQATIGLREIMHIDRPANDGKETNRRSLRFNVPYHETVGDVTVTKMATVKVEVICAANAPAAIRKRVRELAVSGADSSAFAAMVENPEWVW